MTELPGDPTVLVANLPYNVSVPVLLHFLETFPYLQRGVVMVQAEVGERLAAPPGSKIYGAPSVKAAWYGPWRLAGTVSRQVFWPVPNVDSVLVAFTRDAEPRGTEAERLRTFQIVDAAFQQRRKMLRQAVSGVLGGTVGCGIRGSRARRGRADRPRRGARRRRLPPDRPRVIGATSAIVRAPVPRCSRNMPVTFP